MIDSNKKAVIKKRVIRTMTALEKNNIKAFYVENKEDVNALIKSLLNDGDIISFGGSETLKDCDVFSLIKNGSYKVLDRSKDGLTQEDIQKIYRDTFSADVYFSGANAITENGYIYNVDGNGNRVAAITFGPKSVILVAGYNKIVPNLKAAERRIKDVAAPANCLRLNCETPCAKTGRCISLCKDISEMADGCDSERRICASYSVLGRQRVKDRIKVILVGEELGY